MPGKPGRVRLMTGRLDLDISADVARRAGHGVAALLKVYANCIDGQATTANQRINDALDEHDDETG